MILDYVGEYPGRISGVFRRFPLTMAFAFIAAVLLIWMNSIGWASDTVLSKGGHLRYWLQAYPVGAIGVSLAISLFFETRENKGRQILAQILFGTLWAGVSAVVVYCYKFAEKYDSSYGFALFACYAAVFTAPIVLPFLGQKDDRSLWLFAGDVIKRVVISALASLALCGILCMLLAAALTLFDNGSSHSTIYEDVLIFSLTFLTPLFTLSILPKIEYDKNEYKPGKVMYTISRMILPAIVAVYLLIMYAYVVKALIVTPKPGEISTYAFYAIATVIVLVFLQYPNFKKLFPLATIPLLIAFVVDEIFFLPTCHNQGSNLYFALVCLWYIIALAFILLKPNSCVRWMLISFALVMLVGSIGPQRMCNVAKFIPEKIDTDAKNSEAGQKKSDKYLGIFIKAPRVVIDIPQGFSKFRPVHIYCNSDCSVRISDETISFPIYENRDESREVVRELARFEVPTQVLKEMGGDYSPDVPQPIIKNDSASFVVRSFKLRKDSKFGGDFTFEYDGYLFLK